MMVRANEWLEDSKGIELKVLSKAFLGESYEYALDKGYKNPIVFRTPVSYSIGQRLRLLPDLSKVRLIPV